MINLLTSSLESSRPQVVKSAASALFNLLQMLLNERFRGDDDLICIIVCSLMESLRVSLEKDTTEDDELVRLLVVCLGGMIVIAKGSLNPIEKLLISLDAPETISKMSGTEAKEVLNLLWEPEAENEGLESVM